MNLNFTLADIKNALNITGEFQDLALEVYMDEVIGYLTDAGVKPRNITVGIVARGVSDLWNYGSGGGVLSQYFYRRATQLSFKN